MMKDAVLAIVGWLKDHGPRVKFTAPDGRKGVFIGWKWTS